MDRNELTFMTYYQLVGAIEDEWETIPENVKECLARLKTFDYADSLFEQAEVLELLREVVTHSERWCEGESKSLKKEISLRIYELQQDLSTHRIVPPLIIRVE